MLEPRWQTMQWIHWCRQSVNKTWRPGGEKHHMKDKWSQTKQNRNIKITQSNKKHFQKKLIKKKLDVLSVFHHHISVQTSTKNINKPGAIQPISIPRVTAGSWMQTYSTFILLYICLWSIQEQQTCISSCSLLLCIDEYQSSLQETMWAANVCKPEMLVDICTSSSLSRPL